MLHLPGACLAAPHSALLDPTRLTPQRARQCARLDHELRHGPSSEQREADPLLRPAQDGALSGAVERIAEPERVGRRQRKVLERGDGQGRERGEVLCAR